MGRYGPDGEILPVETNHSIGSTVSRWNVRAWQLYRYRWPALYRPMTMLDPFEHGLKTFVNGFVIEEGDPFPEGSAAVNKVAAARVMMETVRQVVPYRRKHILAVRRPPRAERHDGLWFVRCRIGAIPVAELTTEQQAEVARLAALKTRQGTLYRPKLSSLRQFWEESHPEDVDI